MSVPGHSFTALVGSFEALFNVQTVARRCRHCSPSPGSRKVSDLRNERTGSRFESKTALELIVVTTPNPLKPAHIPGQNPNTPERMPGHTGYFAGNGGWRKSAPWILAGLLLLLAALYAFGVIGH